MKLFLVRHGQTTANRDQEFAGYRDVMLTDLGREQARSIRPILEKFTFDRVYSSDLTRAIDTQRLALPGVEAIRTPLLRECKMGSLERVTYDEARQRYGTAFRQDRDYSQFGGESFDQACGRLRQFLSELEADPCDRVAAFVHNGMMLAMLRIAIDGTFDCTLPGSANCAINVFEFDGNHWKLLAWNYMGPV